MTIVKRYRSVSRTGRPCPHLRALALAMALATILTVSSKAQSGGSQNGSFATAVRKSGGDLDLRSAGRFLRDHAAGHVWLGPETVATSSLSVTTGAPPLPGPNTQANDPALDNIQIFPSFAPFLHYTQSETTVAAAGPNIVVSYNDSAGVTLARTPKAGFPPPKGPGPGLVFTRVQLSGYSVSSDGGRTWTSGYVPAAPGVGPFTFGDGVVVVDRRGNFYYSSLGATADRARRRGRQRLH